MIKLIDLLKEDSPFVSRGGKERIEAYSLKRKADAEDKIQQYIKNGMKGNLGLSPFPITSLPDNLTKVGGNLDLSFTQITSLPSNLTVGGYLNLYYTPITSLPSDLKVRGSLNLNNCKKITKLPPDLTVEGNLDLEGTPLSKKYSEKEIRAMIPKFKGKIYM